MSQKTFRNCMAFVILTIIFFLGGCTRYHVTKGTEGCPTCTEVSVWSSREFKAPDLTYSRSGEDVEFGFGAESATNAPSVLEMVGAKAIDRMLNTYFPAPTQEPDQ